MTDTKTATFDLGALEALPAVPGYVEAIRRRAFDEYRALPIPSQETEEWRYTDLSELDLSFVPHAPGHGRDLPGPRGERAGLQIQHNSSVAMTTSNQDLETQGVIFCDLD
jgi:Fe-S cluster assembly scaffold protein SufB